MITVIQPDVTVTIDYFQQWLEESGHEVRIVKTEQEPVPHVEDTGDGIVILGGRMNIFDTEQHPHLNDIRRLIREAVNLKVPLFGICLGHQLLADALGGTVVVSSDQNEDGPIKVTLTDDGKTDTLLRHVMATTGPTFDAAASHNDCVTEVPAGATILATSEKCGIQAFRVGSAFSVQFHPEVSTETMCRWHANDGGDYNEMKEMMAPYENNISAVGKIMATKFGQMALKE